MQSSFRFFVCFAVGFFLALAGCEQWEPIESTTELVQEQQKQMTMSPVTAADYGGSLPLASISCPDAGEKVKPEDIRAPVAALLAEVDDIRNNATSGLAGKVDIVGDTMTGGLTITPTGTEPALTLNAATNQNAAVIVGNGLAYALDITAGTSNGAITAQSSSAEATVEVYNASNGPGVTISGSTSSTIPALGVATTTAQSAATPRMAISANGYLALTGTDPNPSVDPGANNALHGAQITKAWATIDSTYTILDAINVASVVQILGNIWRVNFVRPMANANYGVKIHVHGSPGYSGQHNGTKDVNGFRFVIYDTTDKSLGFGTATKAYIEVTGRQ